MDENYRQLDVWKKSVAVTTQLYDLTSRFPERERQGLATEIRRTASSIATTIAEGWGHQSTGEYLLFWTKARTLLIELGTHLTIALNLGFLESPDYVAVSEPLHEVGKMLNRLISILKSQTKAARRAAACPVSQLPCPLGRSTSTVPPSRAPKCCA